jgi:hypothetical protein
MRYLAQRIAAEHGIVWVDTGQNELSSEDLDPRWGDGYRAASPEIDDLQAGIVIHGREPTPPAGGHSAS